MKPSGPLWASPGLSGPLWASPGLSGPLFWSLWPSLGVSGPLWKPCPFGTERQPPTLVTADHSLTRSVTHSLTHSLGHSLALSLSHSLTRSVSHALAHSLTHSRNLSFLYSARRGGNFRRRGAMHMRCPEGIGRESWEWGGRLSKGWLVLVLPPQSGGRSPLRGVATFGKKRDGPGVKIIVVVVVFFTPPAIAQRSPRKHSLASGTPWHSHSSLPSQ